jgi:hypothetical protein
MLIGANIPLDFLLHKYPDDRAWQFAADLGFTAIRCSGGKSGNVAGVNINNDPDWAENLEALLSKADSYGLKLVFHELGNPWGTELGILAPYFNYRPTTPYTSIPDAITMIDKLGGNNSLGHNFLTDSRVPFWHVTNEAPISEQVVRDWTAAVADHIRSHGGKTMSTLKGDGVPYADFAPIIAFAEQHLDYLDAHEYLYGVVVNDIRTEGASADIYQKVYDQGILRYGMMLDTRGSFPTDRVVLGEWGFWHDSMRGPGAVDPLTVTHQQHADYIRAAFDAMIDVGITNHFYHLPIDDAIEPRGIADSNVVPHPLQYNAFNIGMDNINQGETMSFELKNEDDVAITVVKRKIVVTDTAVTIPSGASVTITLDPDEILVYPDQ